MKFKFTDVGYTKENQCLTFYILPDWELTYATWFLFYFYSLQYIWHYHNNMMIIVSVIIVMTMKFTIICYTGNNQL